MARRKVTGNWRGHYWYDPIVEWPNPPPRTSFGMRLQQSWLFRNFRGEVWDDPPNGVPGPGFIEGRITGSRVFFLKWMPTCHVWWDGRLVTLEDYLRLECAIVLDEPVPPLPIRYTGEYKLEPEELEGVWEALPSACRLLSQGRELALEFPLTTGRWVAQRVQDLT